MMNIVRYKKISSDKIAANKEICRRVCKRAMAVLSIAMFAATGQYVYAASEKAVESEVSSQSETAESSSSVSGTSKTYVIDDAEILSTSEEKHLAELCKAASDKCKLDIVIITMSRNLDGYAMDTYLRSILEKNYGYYATGSDCEAVVYGIDMKSRADRIVTSGRARSDISQSRLDSIREKAEKRKWTPFLRGYAGNPGKNCSAAPCSPSRITCRESKDCRKATCSLSAAKALE